MLASDTNKRIALRIAATSFLSLIDSADRRPCFQLARRHRSKPSTVRGPVLLPPSGARIIGEIPSHRNLWGIVDLFERTAAIRSAKPRKKE